MKQFYLAICLFFTCSFTMHAQITFEKHYGDTNFISDGYSVQQTFDGGYIMTGYQYNTQYNIYVVKTNSLGDTLWTTFFNGDNMVGFDVIQTSDSGFVVCGYKNSTSCDVNLIKLDVNGNFVWNNLFGGSGCQWGQVIRQTFDGGFIVAGWQLYKTDAAGNLVWTKPLTGQAMGIQQTSDSGYVVCCFNGNSIYLNKTDSLGNNQWTKSYTGTLFNPSNNTVAQTSDGGYILTGENTSANHGMLLIKTDMNGDTTWTKNLGGYTGSSVEQTPDGGYAVAGFFENSSTHLDKMFVVKTNSSGIVDWSNTYGYAGDEWGNEMHRTSDGGYIICGGTTSFSAQEFFLVKTDSLGNTVTGITEIPQATNFNVYPNPFSSMVNISIQPGSRTQHLHFEMYDVMGKKVKQFEPSSLNFSFDGADLPSGIYSWRVFTGNEILCCGKVIRE